MIDMETKKEITESKNRAESEIKELKLQIDELEKKHKAMCERYDFLKCYSNSATSILVAADRL